MSHYDIPILIVGAGPTGMTFALEMARHGLGDSVRLIDRAPEASRTSRALVIQPRTLELYDDLEIIEPMLAVAQESTGLHIVFPNRATEVQVDVSNVLTTPASRTTYSNLHTISQDQTERVMAEQLADRGVKIERGLAVVDAVADDSGVTVTVRRSDGTEETIRAGWVIGCDGASSAVRKASGIPFEGSTYTDEFIMADAKLDWELPHGELYAFPAKEGFLAAFSMPGEDRYRIFGAVKAGADGPAAEYSEPTHEDFQALVDERAPVPTKVVEEYWVSRYRIHRRSVPRFRDGRVFLVGDAAHVHSPAGAQGMNTGIQDAYNLAWKLALVQRGVVTGANAEKLLDSYSSERHPIAERLLKVTDRFFQVGSGSNKTASFLREHVGPVIAKRVFTRASFRRWFVGLFAQLGIAYPNSALNAESGTGWDDAPAPGDRAREAGLTIDGQAGRVYDVLRGPHHTVLLFTGYRDGDDDGTDQSTDLELRRLAERIEKAFPGLVVARVVSAERFADHPLILSDADRSAHKTYGVSRASAFVVRPDAHIAYRSNPVDADQLIADLTDRLT